MDDKFNQLRYSNDPNVPIGVRGTVNPNYDEVFSKQNNAQLSVIQERNVKYVYFEEYLAINSNSRDPINYPKHYDYKLNLEKVYKNVKRVEMISAILPFQPPDILKEPFLSVDIEELNYITFSETPTAHKAFAVLPLKPPTSTNDGFINPELGSIYHTALTFRTPLAKLSTLTIKIRDMSGNLYYFGQPNGTTDKAHQNSFVFRITVEETNRSSINQRNVY